MPPSRRVNRTGRRGHVAPRKSRRAESAVRRTGSYRSARRQMRSRRLRRETVYWAVAGIVVAVLVLGAYRVGAGVWSGISGWWQARLASQAARGANRPANLVVIGVEKAKSAKTAVGLALAQVVPAEKKVRGVSLPGDAFVAVPGQGFERAAEALKTGPEVAVATVENLLGVPVEHYVVLDIADYKGFTEQGMATALLAAPLSTDLPGAERARLSRVLAAVPAGEALVVPLPVKTIAVGDDVYFEPQTAQIAEVLKSWWGVEEKAQQQQLRIKILNGVGTPGIAGVAARPLIRAGFRVTDTSNAARFGYARTRIIVYRATQRQIDQIVKVLGVGKVEYSRLAQDVVDVVIVIGKDYRPPKG